jgi:hypothetical protein
MDSMTKILAVDPGHTTGYVIGEFEPEKFNAMKIYNDPSELSVSLNIVRVGEWTSMEELEDLLLDLFHKTDVVVCERYVIYPNRAESHVGDQLETPQIIGIVKWLAWRICCVDVVEQSASQAKQRWPDSRLEKYYPMARIYSPHIQDALRHLLTYIEANV